MRAKAGSIYGSEGKTGSAVRTFSVNGHVLTAPKPAPGLYLVSTPIGNLSDITLRGLTCRHRRPRSFVGADGTFRRGAADGSFLLRGFFAIEANRAAHEAGRACPDRRDAGFVRIRQPRAGYARRSCRDHGWARSS